MLAESTGFYRTMLHITREFCIVLENTPGNRKHYILLNNATCDQRVLELYY